MASIAIEEATSWVARGEVGRVSLLACLDVVVAALGAFLDLFMEEALPRVRTIFAGLREKKNKQIKTMKKKKKTKRRKKMRLK